MTTVTSSFVDESIIGLQRPGRSSHAGVLDLSRNELVHPRLADLVAQVSAGIPAETAIRYPAYPELVLELAHELGCGSDELEIFPGSDDAIGVLVDALARGRRIVLQDPNYPGYAYHAQLRSISVDTWRPRSGPRFDVADLEPVLAHGTQAVVVLTEPHGMLGAELGELAMASLLTAATSGGHLVVVDECYRGFGARPAGELLRGRKDVLRVGSFSKWAGLAGLRLGYVIGPPDLIDYLRRWRRAGAVSATTGLLASTMLRHHGPELDRMRAEVAEGRDRLAGQLVALHPDWRPLPSRANFLTVDVGDRVTTLTAHLASHAIAVRRHDTPGFDSYVQITAAPVPVLAQLVAAVADFGVRR